MPKIKLVEMVYHLTEEPQPQMQFPDDYEIRALSNIHQDRLYPCYSAAFQTGDSQLFMEQNPAERREFFNTLGFDQARCEPGSSMILKDTQIVGFTFVLPYGETNCHISCMVVHPDCQRQGLGAFMVAYAKEKAAAQGYRSITLGTDTSMAAFQLYRRCGFEIQGQSHL